MREKIEYRPRLSPKEMELISYFRRGEIPVHEEIEDEFKIPDPLTPPIKDQEGLHILMGCNHVPFENKEIMNKVIELVSDMGGDLKGFHLMGDFLDLNTLSFHDKGKFTAIPNLTLDKEYDAGNVWLDKFDNVLAPSVWKTYLYGNHEDRFNRHMKTMDNAKTPLVSPAEALRLSDRGYQVKQNWTQDYFTLGKHLDIFHGIYFNVHSAKKHIDVLKGSCAYVHTHRIQSFIEGNTGGFNIGSMANFNAPAFNYASRAMKSHWANGFAVVNIDSEGYYHFTQIITQNDSFYFGGKKY